MALAFVGSLPGALHRHPHKPETEGSLAGMRFFPIQVRVAHAWINGCGAIDVSVYYFLETRSGPKAPSELVDPAHLVQRFCIPVSMLHDLAEGETRKASVPVEEQAQDGIKRVFQSPGWVVVKRGFEAGAGEVRLNVLLTAQRSQSDPAGVLQVELSAGAGESRETLRTPCVAAPSKAPLPYRKNGTPNPSNVRLRGVSADTEALVKREFTDVQPVPGRASVAESVAAPRVKEGGADDEFNNVAARVAADFKSDAMDAWDTSDGASLDSLSAEDVVSLMHDGTGDGLADEEDLYGPLREAHMEAALAAPEDTRPMAGENVTRKRRSDRAGSARRKRLREAS